VANSNSQKAPAQTLAALLAEYPEIIGLTWSIDTSGVIHGSNPDDDGRTVAHLARIIGGTPVRTLTTNPLGDRLALTALVTVFRGAHFDVWTTHETPVEMENARPLGAVVPVLTGGAR
jgi:hypothetical protein